MSTTGTLIGSFFEELVAQALMLRVLAGFLNRPPFGVEILRKISSTLSLFPGLEEV